jgi:hypothetical protein
MTADLTFAHSWSVESLKAAPMIAPARQFVYPLQIAGEEDALGRGAMLLMVKPAEGGMFLATCALGFTDKSMPSGVWACPNANEMCAVAGGYAYVVDTQRPERCTQISLRPVADVKVAAEAGLLVFVGFHSLVAWGAEGMAWETRRLSWEGVRVTEIEGGILRGFGWDMMTDREVAFTVDLRTGESQGGSAPDVADRARR